jgi:very-short-patch-repair endonuclease
VPIDPVTAVQRLGGVARLRDLEPYTSGWHLRRAVASGALVQPGRGRYALPELPPARLCAARAAGTVSHESAAALLGLDSVAPPRFVTLTVRRNAHPVPQRLVRLRWGRLSPAEIAGGVTTALRTVLDCAATLPFAEGLAIADSALRTGVLGPAELAAAADRWRGPGAPTVRRVTAAADGLADNPFESALRATALDAGCFGFRPQVPVPAGRGTRVDLGDAALKVALEADSFAWHGSRAALARDCRRYDELVRCGWVVLRFAWEHVMLEPEWVAQVVSDVVADRRTGRTRRLVSPRSTWTAPRFLPVAK